MVERLPSQPWMSHPATSAVMDALEAAGGDGSVRFVGGCVRNALIGRPATDIDLATTLPPVAVTRSLESAGLRTIATGADHGTITAVAHGRTFQITTLRRDVETDGRHAVVAFTDDWAEDAARRDFRLNALYADRAGRLFDPTGGGVADALAGAIVFVGEAEKRIREDALRILRFFRLTAWYGRTAPDADALHACRDLRALIRGLSAERVAKEWLTLLAADDPRPAVALMASAGVLAEVLPEAVARGRFERFVAIETGMLFTNDSLLRLAALLPDDPAVGRATAERLRLSNAQRDRLAAALGTEPPIVSWMSPRQVRQALYRQGAETFADRVMLAWATSERPAATPQWRALLPIAKTWPIPTLALSGDEVMAAGVPAGPLVGQVLREVEAWWIDNDFTTDKLSLIEALKAIAQGMAY